MKNVIRLNGRIWLSGEEFDCYFYVKGEKMWSEVLFLNLLFVVLRITNFRCFE